ncbi:MAG: phage tail protein [Muribaculaceae bacterium]|nr:phage tail protein [Muribaculaceae bacterium]
MTDNSRQQMPEFYFKVEIPGIGQISCSEISGLDSDEEITYVNNIASKFIVKAHRSLKNKKEVTLKEAECTGDQFKKIDDWSKLYKEEIIRPETVTIQLLDKDGQVVRQWVLNDAYPISASQIHFAGDSRVIIGFLVFSSKDIH